MPGLTPGEQSVMDLFDAGMSAREIASELDISPERARIITQTYDDNPEHDRRREGRIASGSNKLLARLRKAGGHR